MVSKPVGVVGAIVPWNYPQTLAMFKLAPLLAAGCTVVMKPSPETVLDSLLLAEAIIEAGLPPGVVNIVPGRPRGRCLPGGTPGRRQDRVHGLHALRVARSRGAAESCCARSRWSSAASPPRSCSTTPTSSEATEALFGATMANNGQTCNIGTRVLAPRSRYDEVLEVFSGLASALPSATRWTPPRRSVRWRAPASASASRATSRRVAPRARASSPAAAAQPSRTAAGSCSRRSSPTSRTATRSPARRSSGRCSR